MDDENEMTYGEFFKAVFGCSMQELSLRIDELSKPRYEHAFKRNEDGSITLKPWLKKE